MLERTSVFRKFVVAVLFHLSGCLLFASNDISPIALLDAQGKFTDAWEFMNKTPLENLSNKDIMLKAMYCLEGRKGVKKNSESARSLFCKLNARLQIDKTGEAMYYRGICEMYGNSCPTDAFKLIKESADTGYSDAQAMLAMMYCKGIGTKEDKTLAFSYLEKAVANDNPTAKAYLASLLLSRRDNLSRGIALAMESSEKNNREGQYTLAMAFEKGLGIEKNKKRALRLYQLSADQGLRDAELRLIKLKKSLNISQDAYIDDSFLFNSYNYDVNIGRKNNDCFLPDNYLFWMMALPIEKIDLERRELVIHIHKDSMVNTHEREIVIFMPQSKLEIYYILINGIINDITVRRGSDVIYKGDINSSRKKIFPAIKDGDWAKIISENLIYSFQYNVIKFIDEWHLNVGESICLRTENFSHGNIHKYVLSTNDNVVNAMHITIQKESFFIDVFSHGQKDTSFFYFSNGNFRFINYKSNFAVETDCLRKRLVVMNKFNNALIYNYKGDLIERPDFKLRLSK